MPTPRDLDTQSGKNRVSRRKGKKPTFAPEPAESEPEITQSDTEAEEEMDIPRREEFFRRRPEPKSAKPKSRPQPVGKTPARSYERDADEVDTPKEPTDSPSAGFSLMLAATLQIGLASIVQQHNSYYVPDCSNYGSAMYAIALVITDNVLLHDRFVGYTSVGFYLYCSYLWFYQYLRVRDDAQVLTRIERRCLRALNQISPPEAWYVPTPLIPFLQALGQCKPEGAFYGLICPMIDLNFGELSAHAHHGLTDLYHVHSISRIPGIPALTQFLRNIGDGTAQFDDTNGQLYPLADKALSAANTFLQLASSDMTTDTNDARTFFAMTQSGTFSMPTEVNHANGNADLDVKRPRIQRWRVPNHVANTTQYDSLQNWLRLADDSHLNGWIKNLLAIGSNVCRFFPGSVNLGSIPLTTMTENFTYTVRTEDTTTKPPEADSWYYYRHFTKLDVTGFINRTESGPLIKQAIATGVRCNYVIASGITNAGQYLQQKTDGPYFVNAPNEKHSTPVPLVESEVKYRPETWFYTHIQDVMYDHLGGAAQRS